MSLNADYLDNTGDYLLLLSLFLKEKIGTKAEVLFEEDICPQDPDKPVVILPPVEIVETQWSHDGRHQDVVSVSVLIRVPNSLATPSIQAQNVGGFVRAYIAGQLFGDYLNEEYNCVDEPQEIKGTPLRWNTNEQGYEITFEQTIRYGTEETLPFTIVGEDSPVAQWGSYDNE